MCTWDGQQLPPVWPHRADLRVAKHGPFAELIEQIVVTTNQLEVLASHIIKHHVFSTLELKGGIPFAIDQSYISKVFDFLRQPNPRSATKYDLRPSVDEVMKAVKSGLVFPAGVTKTCWNEICNYSARTMKANIEVHIKTRLQQSFDLWTKNQTRAVMKDEEFKDQKGNIKTFPFYSQHQAYEA